MPYNHMLSISADDLLETSEWSRAPSSELRPTTDLPQAADLAKNTVKYLYANVANVTATCSTGFALFRALQACLQTKLVSLRKHCTYSTDAETGIIMVYGKLERVCRCIVDDLSIVILPKPRACRQALSIHQTATVRPQCVPSTGCLR
jgi:hypothetical protein